MVGEISSHMGHTFIGVRMSNMGLSHSTLVGAGHVDFSGTTGLCIGLKDFSRYALHTMETIFGATSVGRDAVELYPPQCKSNIVIIWSSVGVWG